MILLENRGEVVEKEDLIRSVWADAYVTEANLTQNVSSLRKAADVLAVPGNPLADIKVMEKVKFVMKGGEVFKNEG